MHQVKAKAEAANEQRGSPEDWIEFRDARQMGELENDPGKLFFRVTTACWHTMAYNFLNVPKHRDSQFGRIRYIDAGRAHSLFVLQCPTVSNLWQDGQGLFLQPSDQRLVLDTASAQTPTPAASTGETQDGSSESCRSHSWN